MDPAAGCLFARLLDDAALFPPAGLSMAKAVAAHLKHQTAWYAPMSGPFVCPDARLPELRTVLSATGVLAIDLSLVVTGGTAGLGAAMDAVAADPRLRLRAAEVPAARDAEPLPAAASAADAMDAGLPAGAHGYIEVPVAVFGSAAGAAVAGLIADRGYRPKLRTGGVTAAAFPGEEELAACLAALTDRRLAFKCTAGLHHAVRNTDSATGFEQHGFLNVMIAVSAGLDGAGAGELARMLALRDSAQVTGRVTSLSRDAALDIRAVFASLGTCSTDEPVTDLVTLGLASPPHGG